MASRILIATVVIILSGGLPGCGDDEDVQQQCCECRCETTCIGFVGAIDPYVSFSHVCNSFRVYDICEEEKSEVYAEQCTSVECSECYCRPAEPEECDP